MLLRNEFRAKMRAGFWRVKCLRPRPLYTVKSDEAFFS